MSNNNSAEVLSNNFKIPSWAGKPHIGLHLDVLKEGKLVQKLIIDEKSCYFFGRNRQLCDFTIDHQSCSRVHAVLVWHKFLGRAFLLDLGSVHGTWIGKIRLEAHKPQQVPIDSELHFGASTRIYVLRERPNPLYSISEPNSQTIDGTNFIDKDKHGVDGLDSNTNSHGLIYSQLPQTDVELDNLTEFNTAHNRRISSMVDISTNVVGKNRKVRVHNVHFSDVDELINPEDVDPSVGRFRNLVQETFIPNKRAKGSHDGASLGISAPAQKGTGDGLVKSPNNTSHNTGGSLMSVTNVFGPNYSLAAKLGLPFPNLAPDVETEPQEPILPSKIALLHAHANSKFNNASLDGRHKLTASDILGASSELDSSGNLESGFDSGLVESSIPKKKKYAKEAWPGKRPAFLIGPTA